MKIVILGRAPSVNGLYRIGKGRKVSCRKCGIAITIPGSHIYLSADGRSYKIMVAKALAELKITLPRSLQGVPLLVRFIFYHPTLWRANGEPEEWDTSNRIKVVEDAVFKAIKKSDAWVFSLSARKREGPERAVVEILAATPEDL